jgi:hypothetical protein
MGHPLTVMLPDELHQPLVQVASAAGQTPEEWVAILVRQRLPRHDARLRRHFGAVNLGQPTGIDNAQIDADLARAYADDHREP